MRGPTFNDLMNAHQRDLKRIYRMNSSQMEQSVRKHLDGANSTERREVYEKVFGENNKRDA
jgi:hypothetical protein